jgi:pantetheine-phosphate adenylyltransferase
MFLGRDYRIHPLPNPPFNNTQMKVAVYAGSFNPYHRGHENIRQKGLKIFDRLIIARGVNPDKAPSTYQLPDIIDPKDVMTYSGLLTDFIKELQKELSCDNVTLIRGLRNAVDLEYEKVQYRYLQDLMPEIQVVSLFCDAEFEHISSSGIRMLKNYGPEKVEKYLF